MGQCGFGVGVAGRDRPVGRKNSRLSIPGRAGSRPGAWSSGRPGRGGVIPKTLATLATLATLTRDTEPETALAQLTYHPRTLWRLQSITDGLPGGPAAQAVRAGAVAATNSRPRLP